MTDIFKEKEEEILEVTQQNVQELMTIWRQIFDNKDCEENLCKLVHHARNFYTDLIKESLEKQRSIENDISYLQEEAELLRRLLNIDVQLPTFNNQKDIPLLSIQIEMDRSLSQLRVTLRKRREEISQLLLEQKELCDDLGEPVKPLRIDPLPTEDELVDFRAHLQDLIELRAQRRKDLLKIRGEIKEFLQTLEIDVKTDTEHRLLHDINIKLNSHTFERLRHMHNMYGEQVQELHARIENMRKQLEKLWQRLDTSPQKREKYRKYDGYSQKVYEVLSQELQRCETLKRQNIKSFVEQLRVELQQWWDKILKSEAERKSFTHFYNNCYTDDLLVLHEMELEEVKHFYEANHQIFELYEERQLLWDRMTALEVKEHDPARYNNRGGQLLREEKERKTIANKLPKIEQKISELVAAFEASEGIPFLINGENILELMAKQWDQKRQEREQQTSARRQKTPNSKAGTSMARTPMSRNTSTMGRSVLRSTRTTPSQTILRKPMTTVSSQKRKLNEREKFVPNAKRSLNKALDSPSALLRLPTPVQENSYNTSSVASIMSNLRHRPQFKSPLKKKTIHVLASTIKRRSQGRHSGGVGSATRTNKKGSSRTVVKAMRNTPTKPMPDIKVIDCDGNGDDDDAYDTFEKCIEVRSSIIDTVKAKTTNSNQRQRRIIHTPSKSAHREYTVSTTNNPVPRILPHSPSSCRKLTTKNLPIII